MKLIVGLGNPGKEYEKTRHNIGFLVVDNYLKAKNCDVVWSSKFNGLFAQVTLFGEKVIFLKPQSFMNLSGEVVSKFVNYFKINLEDILIISDDLDLKVGNFKVKDKGSSGGHNGLKNIENCLGSSNYKRLKIGISNDKTMDTKDYVLGKISTEELEILDKLKDTINNLIDDYFELTFDKLMNKYNQKNR